MTKFGKKRHESQWVLKRPEIDGLKQSQSFKKSMTSEFVDYEHCISENIQTCQKILTGFCAKTLEFDGKSTTTDY